MTDIFSNIISAVSRPIEFDAANAATPASGSRALSNMAGEPIRYAVTSVENRIHVGRLAGFSVLVNDSLCEKFVRRWLAA